MAAIRCSVTVSCGPRMQNRYIGPIVACALTVFRPVVAAQEVDVRVVSSRPDTVSGDEALIEARVPNESNWHAQLNGRNVTSLFRKAEYPDRRFALSTGLKPGKNSVQIRVGNRSVVKLEFLVHPLTGPIFTGPH